MILRCTGKMLALLRIPPAAVGEPSEQDWYAHLLWVDGRKCVLLTHAGTLFSVFVADVIARDVRRVGAFTTAAITAALTAEGLPADALGGLDAEDVTVAKTADRRIVGTMNDLAATAVHIIDLSGGLAQCDIDAVNRDLHRTINSITGYIPPIALVHTNPRQVREAHPRGR